MVLKLEINQSMDKQSKTSPQNSHRETKENLAFLTLPNEESLDKSAANLLIVVKKLIGDSFDVIRQEFYRKIEEEGTATTAKLQDKLAQIQNIQEYTQKRIEPLLPLINIVPPGQSLIECLASHLIEKCIQPEFKKIREGELPLYAKRAELKSLLAGDRDKASQDIGTVRSALLHEIDNLKKRCLFSEVFDRHKLETQNYLDELNRKSNSVKGMIESIQTQIVQTQEQLAKKADYDKIIQIHSKLEEYATLEYAYSVEREMRQRATRDEMESVRSDFQKKFEYLKLISETQVTKDDLAIQLKEIKENTEQKFKLYHLTSDFTQFQENYDKILAMDQQKTSKIRSKVKRIEEDIELIGEVLNQKTDQVEFRSLQMESKTFALKEQINAFESKWVPNLESFTMSMNVFRVEREQHTQILLRYDEILSDKASKFQVFELREEIHNSFSKIKQVQTMDIFLKEQKVFVMSMQEETQRQFQEMNENITIEIYQAVKKASSQMAKIVIKSQEETEYKSKGMGQDLMTIINKKASASEMENLNLTKANKVDTEQLLDSLSVVHRQLKQALVLFIDSIKTDIENPAESAQAKDNKQKFILIQLNFLAKWVIGFDPMSLNYTDLGEGLDFLEQSEGKQLIEYTDQLMKETSQLSHLNMGSVPTNFKHLTFTKSRGSTQRNLSQTIQVKGNHEIHHQSLKSALGYVSNNNKLITVSHPSQISFQTQKDLKYNYSNMIQTHSDNTSPIKHIDRGNFVPGIGNQRVGRSPMKIETAPTSPLGLKEVLIKEKRNALRESPGLERGLLGKDLPKAYFDLPPIK